ncbi:hypothetical protein ACFXHA_00565 [Nocardia sp. NPDC059240]|uniref:hypothetical protein n=1 Tax=Nocardia sp. NPDC059240 TaxID=3346786 RepID=UPI0036B202A0
MPISGNQTAPACHGRARFRVLRGYCDGAEIVVATTAVATTIARRPRQPCADGPTRPAGSIPENPG